jgi:DNA-directed RNA polymerase specialized sigma24 family protein
MIITPAFALPRGDEEALYRRHHRSLQRAVARAVNAPRELIEDACQTAWTVMLRSQPDRRAIFTWLRVVAIHEAYRLSRIHRTPRLEDLDHSEGWDAVIAHHVMIDDTDLALRVAGFSYREIAQLTGGRTYTNVNKHLRKARARIRLKELGDAGANTRRRSSS